MLKRKKFNTIILGFILGIGFSCLKPSFVSAESQRLWGQNRYETAVAVSQKGWTTSDYVVIASGAAYPDALCASPLAKKYNAPILLTESTGLNSKIKEEIKRLKAKHVFIIGKEGAVSQSAENELTGIVEDVQRIGGKNRFETSVLVAEQLGNISNVVVTSGYGYADALSIAPVAALKNMPILLTAKDQVSSEVQNYINKNINSIQNSYVIGGIGAVGNNIAESLPKNVRLGGSDRYETNINIMNYFSNDLNFENLYVVQADGSTGGEFADALTGTPLAVQTSSPLILTYKNVSEKTQNFIKGKINSKSAITAVGGAAAVPESVVDTLQNCILVNGASDLDTEFVFSNDLKSKFNFNKDSSIDISNNFKNNNLVKIKIYSSTSRDVSLSISGMESTKHLYTGWNEFSVPLDFGLADNGSPGVEQSSMDFIGSNNQFKLNIKSGSYSKNIVVNYR